MRAGLLALLSIAPACGTSRYEVVITTDAAAVLTDGVFWEMAILHGSCDESFQVGADFAEDGLVRRLSWRGGQDTPTIGLMDPGRYALYVRVRDLNCLVRWAGCASVSAEEDGDGRVEIPIAWVLGPGCDDELVCNGQEVCTPEAGCVAVDPVDCGDAVDCTTDVCFEPSGDCFSTPEHAACSDGEVCDAAAGCVRAPACSSDEECPDAFFCNGEEVCGPGGTCAGSPPPDCSDGVGCTIDWCDPWDNECGSYPWDDLCSDGLSCTFDSCDAALDCQSPVATCWSGAECTEETVDPDLDGYGCWADCDDDDEYVYEGAFEYCDGVDEDCSGTADDVFACVECADQWIGETHYSLCTGAHSWEEARAACWALFGDLAVPGSDEELDALATAAFGLVEDNWWIGANDLSGEGSWTFADGATPVTYLPFPADGTQPNGAEYENCIVLDLGLGGAWNDKACEEVHPAVCWIPS